jgi:hypothetical protein
MANKKPFKHKPNNGSLFKNTKRTKKSHPQYTGSYMSEDGEEFWVSAWTHTTDNGSYLSFTMKPKEVEEDDEDLDDEDLYDDDEELEDETPKKSRKKTKKTSSQGSGLRSLSGDDLPF